MTNLRITLTCYNRVHCRSAGLKLLAHQLHFKCFFFRDTKNPCKTKQAHRKGTSHILLKEDSKMLWWYVKPGRAFRGIEFFCQPIFSFSNCFNSSRVEIYIGSKMEDACYVFGGEGGADMSSWIVGQAHGRNRKHRGRSSTVVWPLPHHFRGMTFHLGIVAQEILHSRNTSTWQQCLLRNHRQKLQNTQCLVAGPPE